MRNLGFYKSRFIYIRVQASNLFWISFRRLKRDTHMTEHVNLISMARDEVRSNVETNPLVRRNLFGFQRNLRQKGFRKRLLYLLLYRGGKFPSGGEQNDRVSVTPSRANDSVSRTATSNSQLAGCYLRD